MKNRGTVLDRLHPAGGKAPPIANALHLEHNGHFKITRKEKIAVERMDKTVIGHRLHRGAQRLGHDLPAKNPLAAHALALAAEKINFQLLHPEQFNQLTYLIHSVKIKAKIALSKRFDNAIFRNGLQ